MLYIVESTGLSCKIWLLGGVHDNVTSLVRKDGCPHSMEFESLLLHCLHYTDTKMSLSGKELKNDGLRHNKHMINGCILLGWALEGRVGPVTRNLHFFYFANSSQSNLSP